MEERFSLDLINSDSEKIVTVSDAVDIFVRYKAEEIKREELIEKKK